MSATKIEWAEAVWNPLGGCTKVSPGCKHCYAERMAKRLAAMAKADVAAGRDPGRKAMYRGTVDKNGRWTGVVNFDEAALEIPLKRKKPTVYFVNSMSDLFHEGVTFEMRRQIFGTMHTANWHRFIVLTKRPEEMPDFFEAYNESVGFDAWPREYGHVVIGTSVENQAAVDERIPWLLKTPAAYRMVSMEPLLGPVDCSYYLTPLGAETCCGGEEHRNGECECLPGLDWVIVGGESGPGARAMHPDWARGVRDQCLEAGVNFFFKQWGEWAPANYEHPTSPHNGWVKPKPNAHYNDGAFSKGVTRLQDEGFAFMERVGKKAAGRLLDGRAWDQTPWGMRK